MDTEAFMAGLAARAAGCFLCAWIAQDYGRHGHVAKQPALCVTGDPLFPPEARRRHLELEGLVGKDEEPPIVSIAKEKT